MKKLCFLSSLLPKLAIRGNDFARSLTTCLVVFGILFSCGSFAQYSLPPASSCTSGDLLLLDATLPPPPGTPVCGACTPGTLTTRTLYLNINNKTGSLRTAFRFWGTLKIFNADGTLKSSDPITRCGGPIQPSIINNIDVGTISYICGESIQLTDLFLAWTTSNKKEDCTWLLANSSTINPKCGTVPTINVFTGLDAVFTSTQIRCNGRTGAIASDIGGGKAPYILRWKKDGVDYPAGNSTLNTPPPFSQTLSGLEAGSYVLTITDANGCIKTKAPVVINAAPAALALGTCDKTDGACPSGLGSIIAGTVTNAVGTVSYNWKNASGTLVGTTPTVTGRSPGTYNLTVTDECFSRTCSVTVGAPAPPAAPTNPGHQSVCATSPIQTLTATATVPTGITLVWYDAATNGATVGSPTWSSIGTKIYYAQAENGTCVSATRTPVSLEIKTLPTAGAGSDVTINCTSPSTTLAATGGGSYSWSPSAGLSATNIANPVATPAATTTYTVNVTGANACTATASVIVTVDNDAVTVSAGSAFTKTCLANTAGKQIGETAVSGYTYS